MCGLRSDRPDARKTRARCFGVGPKHNAARGSYAWATTSTEKEFCSPVQ